MLDNALFKRLTIKRLKIRFQNKFRQVHKHLTINRLKGQNSGGGFLRFDFQHFACSKFRKRSRCGAFEAWKIARIRDRRL